MSGWHGIPMFWETMNLVTSLYVLSNALIKMQLCYSPFCIIILQTHYGSLNLKLSFHVLHLSLSWEQEQKQHHSLQNIRNIMLPGKQVLLWDSVRDPLSAFCCHFLCNKEKRRVICSFHCNLFNIPQWLIKKQNQAEAMRLDNLHVKNRQSWHWFTNKQKKSFSELGLTDVKLIL